jgi:hypothetical protein
MGVGGQHQAPATLLPGKRAGTLSTGDWVGPRAGLVKCGNSRPPPGFDPRTVQPVASRYADYAILAQIIIIIITFIHDIYNYIMTQAMFIGYIILHLFCG